jgi:hypothetical protein
MLHKPRSDVTRSKPITFLADAMEIPLATHSSRLCGSSTPVHAAAFGDRPSDCSDFWLSGYRISAPVAQFGQAMNTQHMTDTTAHTPITTPFGFASTAAEVIAETDLSGKRTAADIIREHRKRCRTRRPPRPRGPGLRRGVCHRLGGAAGHSRQQRRRVCESGVVADCQRALSAGDVDAIVAVFEPDGYARAPSGGEYLHSGPAGLRAFYELLFSNDGGIPLEHCALFDDQRACALVAQRRALGEGRVTPGGRDRCLRLGSKRQARGGPHL